MPCIKKRLYPIFLLLFMLFLSCTNKQENIVTLHYLGHSSVYIDFGNDISVLCDYGKENAYLEWGWDSPIYDAGETSPDILCYSHEHEDHYDELRAEKFKSLILSGPVDTTIGKLHISSFESSERDISKYDNMSYLFTYKGIRVLHLGDCQADIMMINDPAHAWNLEQRYPKDCDILIMPIESTQKFILQTVKMAELLEPRVLIPTHYWSPEYKQEFIDAIEQTYSRKGKDLEIEQKHGAEFVYSGRDKEEGVLLLDLTPSAKNGK